MLCFSNWTSYRFKSQLQIGFGLIGFGVLASIFLTVSLFTWRVTENQQTSLRNRLLETAQEQTQSISAESALVFGEDLRRNAANFLSPLAYAAGDWSRTNEKYAFESVPSYYEWLDLLPLPKTFQSRFNSTVSYTTSAYSVARQNPFTQMPTWSRELNQTIEYTEGTTSWLMASLYRRNPDFLTGYYCLHNGNHNGAMGLSPRMATFREYPAVSNGNFNQMLAYDCSLDNTWYNDAYREVVADMQTNSGRASRSPTFTSAYFDAWVRQTMITITQPIFHPETGELLGVAGGDLLTSTLSRSIQSAPYLKHGRAVLFQVDASHPTQGFVIVDSSVSPATLRTSIESIQSLRNPTLSSSLWSQMYQLDKADGTSITTTFTETGEWYIACRGLDVGIDQYMLCMFVWRADVLQALESVLDDISAAQTTTLIVNCVVCSGLLVLSVAIALLLARSIVAPVRKLTEDSVKLIERIGGDDMGHGIEMTVVNSSVLETHQLQEAHRQMIQTILVQQQQQQQACQPGLTSDPSCDGGTGNQVADYALPAYAPNLPFDRSVLLPVGVAIGDASSMPPPYSPEAVQPHM